MFSGADKSMLHICITGPNKLLCFQPENIRNLGAQRTNPTSRK